MVRQVLSIIKSICIQIQEKPVYRYLFYFIVLFPLYFFRDFTPDNELRYLSITSEALNNHTWFTFSNHGLIYGDKPPLYFWILIACKLFTGSYPMPILGLFSLIPAILIMCVMDRWITKYADAKNHPERLGGLLMFSTAYFLGATFVIRMDMLMSLFIVLSLYTFYKMYNGDKSSKNKVLLLLFVFLGAFTKGPSAIAIPFVVIVVFLLYNKQLKSIFSYFSWISVGLFLLLGFVWIVMIYKEGGTAYLNNILIKQTIGRGINAFHHKEPFYYYLISSLYTFAPWTLLYLVALLKRNSKEELSSLSSFFLITFISSFILFSLISSKLDIYLLPLYPFLIYYTALKFEDIKNGLLTRISLFIPAVICILILPALFILRNNIALPFPITNIMPFLIGAIGLSICGLTAFRRVLSNPGRSIVLIGCGLFFFLFAGAFGLKQLNPYTGLKYLSDQVKTEISSNPEANVAYYRFRGGSDMDVYLGVSPKRLETPAEMDTFINNNSCIILLMRQKDYDANWMKFFKDDSKLKLTPVGSYWIIEKITY